jgi:hypothetical protein
MKAIKLLSLVSVLVPAIAYADPASPESPSELTDSTGNSFDHAVAPVKNAFELGVAAGYSQGAGQVSGGMPHLQDLSGPGGIVEIDAGYRIIPAVSVGLYGTFAQYQNGDQVASSTDVYGATAGVQAVAHLRPDRSIDPWVSLGTGWKGEWLNPTTGKVTSLQGLELARLQIGADYRVSKDVAIAPMIGGSLGMFVSEDTPMTTDYTEIETKKVNFTGFAGLSGRFDLGGNR